MAAAIIGDEYMINYKQLRIQTEYIAVSFQSILTAPCNLDLSSHIITSSDLWILKIKMNIPVSHRVYNHTSSPWYLQAIFKHLPSIIIFKQSIQTVKINILQTFINAINTKIPPIA
jgi:hypothetical protein